MRLPFRPIPDAAQIIRNKASFLTELVWRLTETFTQEQTAKAMGWSRPLVAQYSQLKKIDEDAWKIVVTSFSKLVTSDDDDEVTDYVTTVTTPFSERLLRNILDLDPGQQVELCGYLAH